MKWGEVMIPCEAREQNLAGEATPLKKAWGGQEKEEEL